MSTLATTNIKNPDSSTNNIVLNTNGTVDSLNIDGNISAASFNGGQLGGRRNLIINGAMQVAQRSTSVTGITASGYHTVDRFVTVLNSMGTWTQTQETDAPDGFANSLKLECTAADASPAAGDYVLIQSKFEGQDLQHLKKGTSSAESVTASFWVKSNKTGTYIVELLDSDNSSRHISKSYTVDASGTWEYKTITFEGDTTGAFDNDNAPSLQINIWFGGGSNFTGGSALQTSWGVLDNPSRAVGQVNLADSTSNYFQLTGVQLELGETATPFEHRSYGEELALCQRYYNTDFALQYDTIGSPYNNLSTIRYAYYIRENYPVTMRTNPTLTYIVAESYAQSNTHTSNFVNFGNTNKKFSIRNGNAAVTYAGDISLDYAADAEL